MTQCPVCRAPLPQEHWRVFAEVTACLKPAPPPPPPEASLITKGIDHFMSAVEGVVAAMSPPTDPKKRDG